MVVVRRQYSNDFYWLMINLQNMYPNDRLMATNNKEEIDE
jgi:hypothetical protein